MSAERRDALPSGTRIGEYRIERILGAGGFGITYLAIDENLNSPVAIKEYLPVELAMRGHDMSVQARSASDDKTFAWGLDRFRDEAQILARFDHPNIVRVLRYLEANHTAYMVMKYIEGESLRDLLTRRGKLSEEEMVSLLSPLLDGLALVHRAGVLHRDIKPGNLQVKIGGVPVLLDFGAARQAIGERSRSMTAVLTPPYAPYEQYGSQPQGPWTDIYALAVVTYEALSGSPGFPAATDRMVGTDPLIPLTKIARVSPAMAAAVTAGLQVEGAKRPQNVEEWRNILLARKGPAPTPLPSPTVRSVIKNIEIVEPSSAVKEPFNRNSPQSVFAFLSVVVIPGLWLLLLHEAGANWEAESDRLPICYISAFVLLLAILSAFNASRLDPATMRRRFTYYASGILGTLALWVALFCGFMVATKDLMLWGIIGNQTMTALLIGTSLPAFAFFHIVWRYWKRKPVRRIVPIAIAVVLLVGLFSTSIMSRHEANRIEAEFQAEQQRVRDEASSSASAIKPIVDKVLAKAETSQKKAFDFQAKAKEAETQATPDSSDPNHVFEDLGPGESYAGLYRGGHRYLGVYSWPDGDRYEGQFHKDQFEGYAVLSSKDGTHYEGAFLKDKKAGFGILTLADGTRYEGEFVDDNKNGRGVQTTTDLSVLAGIWKDGDFQRPFTKDDVP